MKKQLNAGRRLEGVSPPTSIVSTPGAPGSMSEDVANGSVIDGGFGALTSSSGSIHEKGSPKSFLTGVEERHDSHLAHDGNEVSRR